MDYLNVNNIPPNIIRRNGVSSRRSFSFLLPRTNTLHHKASLFYKTANEFNYISINCTPSIDFLLPNRTFLPFMKNHSLQPTALAVNWRRKEKADTRLNYRYPLNWSGICEECWVPNGKPRHSLCVSKYYILHGLVKFLPSCGIEIHICHSRTFSKSKYFNAFDSSILTLPLRLISSHSLFQNQLRLCSMQLTMSQLPTKKTLADLLSQLDEPNEEASTGFGNSLNKEPLSMSTTGSIF